MAAGGEGLAFTHVQAVRAQALDAPHGPDVAREQPPATGWADVQLPDTWASRWPGFDGVVWYRLTWEQAGAEGAQAVFIDYLNMAGAVYLNGVLLERDASLAEPLSRSWNVPRHIVLPHALLHRGQNTLWLRVSGLAAYQAGLGPMSLGPMDATLQRYDSARLLRYTLPLANAVLSFGIGCLFLLVWLLRRQDAIHGWFALTRFAWTVVAANQLVTTPWPFGSTHGWSVMTGIAFSVYSTCYTVFVLRLCERRWPRCERALWLLTAVFCTALLATPHPWAAHLRDVVFLTLTLQFLATTAALIVFAWRHGNPEQRLIALWGAVCIGVAIHDLLTTLGLLGGNIYYASLTGMVLALCIAIVLARQFVGNLRRTETFNREMQHGIQVARADLARTLNREHALEMANARLHERLQLAHDLHDGLGGTLVSSIIALERSPQAVDPQRFLAILKELRDDLRIIIDTAASQHNGPQPLAEQIAPLRHRLTQLLEAHGIDCHWHVEGVDDYALDANAGLEIMRLLQESLTNVFKHSHARRVDVTLRRDAQGLTIDVADDGVGFDPGQAERGIGMRSMRARISRLGGQLNLHSVAGQTRITAHLAPTVAHAASGPALGIRTLSTTE